MKVGNYQIGRYHGIIKKTYEDGSWDYETSFSDSSDIAESYYSICQCKGELVGIATDHPKVLKSVELIRGKENIIKELEEKNEQDKTEADSYKSVRGRTIHSVELKMQDKWKESK